MARTPYGEWTPDLDALLAQATLQDAKNVLPKVGGYKPMPGLANLNTQSLPFAPVGAFRGKRDDGTNQFFAIVQDTTANDAKIYQFKPTDIGGGVIEDRWVDVTNALGLVSITSRRAEFAQFGASIFCATYTNETQGLDTDRESTFSRVSATCPRAAHLTVAENFLFVGDLYTRDGGTLRNAIQWSAINDPYNWPIPGTDAATAVLSGQQVFEGNGGPVQAVIAGSEVIAIFQQEAIWRADFVGGDVVWRFSNVEEEIGLLIKGAAQAFGRAVFFVAEDGFRLFDYTSSKNIGKGRVNDWFFDNYDQDYPNSFSMSRDPQDTRVAMSFAAPGNLGVPNRLVVYDWSLDRFAYGEVEVHSMIGAGTTPASLDSADVAGDQDTLEDNIAGGADEDYDIQSFDDVASGTGSRVLGGFDSQFRLAQFNGTNLDGVLESGDLELTPGRRSLLTGVRSHVKGTGVTVQAAEVKSDELEEPSPLAFTIPKPRDKRSGIHPIRLDARYHRFRINLGKTWTEASFFDPEFGPSGLY